MRFNKFRIKHNNENLPSLNLAFDLARERLAYQLSQIDGLDNKANSFQIAAPGLVGADLVLLAVLLSLQRSALVHSLQDLLLIPLLFSCAVTMFYASNSYKVGNYTGTPYPDALRKYLQEPESYTKEMMLEATIAAFDKNEEEINKKVKILNRARLAFNVELLIFTVILAAQVLLFQFVN